MMDWKPERKIGYAAAVGTPAGVILAWVIGLTGVVVPPEVAAALGALVAALVGYWVPNK